MLHQDPIAQQYTALPDEEAMARIARIKHDLGQSLCILGHHYQADEIIRFADFTGDSLKLSQQAARTQARYIVFCGVHFMAESADILARPDQTVILPDLSAGCSMAAMAEADDVADALLAVQGLAGGQKVLPITYVNSSAAVKAITGQAGGACCTSSNARNAFEWALRAPGQGGAGAQKILAIPDQHLARNMALAMGYTLDDCVVYDPRLPDGGLSKEQVHRATFILWKGHCYVHQRFTVEHVRAVRRLVNDIQVIVHPECPYQVVQAADLYGSTEQILHAVTNSPAGSKWAVGTEVNMVRRLAASNPDKLVRVLSDTPPLCVMMDKIDLPHLLWVLENLLQGAVVNRIHVPQASAADARLALHRMLDIQPTATASQRK